MRELLYTDSGFEAAFAALIDMKRENDEDVDSLVAAILADVRKRGDAALLGYTARFDRVELKADSLRITVAEIDEAVASCDSGLIKALNLAAKRIHAFHIRQLPKDYAFTDRAGVRRGLRWTAVQAAGLYVPGGTAAYSGSWDQKIVEWDLETGKERRRLEGHINSVASLALSRDGKRLVSASWDRTLRVWDLATGKTVAVLNGHTQNVMQTAFLDAAGTRVVSSGYDLTVRIWDVAAARELFVLKGHQTSVNAVAVSPDFALIASGSVEGEIRLWDASAGTEIARLEEGHRGFIAALVFSPDGKRLASGSGDRSIVVGDVALRRPLRRLVGHEKGVFAVAFAPDGKRIVSGGFDTVIKVWDAETGLEVPKP